MSEATERPYRDLTGLMTWSRRLLAVQVMLSALAAMIAIGHGPGFDNEVGGSAFWFVTVLFYFLNFVAAGVVVLRWIYFANVNARALGAEGMNASPRMAVGSYFIPIANLAMPFQSMREIWKASSAPHDWEIEAAPAIIGWWWLFWLLSTFASNISFQIDMKSPTGTGQIGEMLELASELLTIAASILLIRIIGRVTKMQQARHQESLFC